MRARRGFTLVELLIVTLVIGILASIALVKLNDSKQRAYLATMKSELNTVATMAEAQYSSESTYANVVAPVPTNGVTLTFVGLISSWTATATHRNAPGTVCTLTTDVADGHPISSAPFCE